MNLPLGTTAWEDRINAAWRGSASNFILAGKTLLECKEAVPPGSFHAMLKSGRLDFKPRMAEYLMAIAEDPRLSDAKNFSLLPMRMMTLYDLRKLDDDAFYSALRSGEINKTMKRVEAKKLLPKPKGKVIDVDHEDIPPVTTIEAVRVTKQIDKLMEESPAVSPVAEEAVPETEVAESPSVSLAADDPEGRDTDRQLTEAEITAAVDKFHEVYGEGSVLDPEPGVRTPEAVAQEITAEDALLALDREESNGTTPAELRRRLPMSDDRFMDILNWLLDADQIIRDERERPEAAA